MMTSLTQQQPSASGKGYDSEIILSVNGVSKKFCRDLKKSLLYGLQDIGGEIFGLREQSDRLRKKEFWALDNVSFQLRRGEALGLIGKNGSGKSTILRIIAGLIKPDTGFVEVKGRVAPLIALGAGFNPILTGRENLYANMSILGLSSQEIKARFDEVVEFAEIGEAIDSPVQSYSSGMAARLGFASAIYTEPDILLIDEVLAVGDVKFRIKCHKRLAELRKKGTSFILVSHSPHSILSVCDSAVYLSKGKLISAGDTLAVMNQYEQDLFSVSSVKSQDMMVLPEKNKQESTGLDIRYLCFKDKAGNVMQLPSTGETTHLCIGCKVSKHINNLRASLAISDVGAENERVLLVNTEKGKDSISVSPGNFEIRFSMPYLGLKPGLYNIKVQLGDYDMQILDETTTPHQFTVKNERSMSQCLFYQPGNWEVTQDYLNFHQKYSA